MVYNKIFKKKKIKGKELSVGGMWNEKGGRGSVRERV
jgi:hypothetical protein